MLPLIKITTPDQWYKDTIGKLYDTDNYPRQKFQCWDYFDYFCKCGKMQVSTYCSRTGYVTDLWQDRDRQGFSKYFDFITDTSKLQDGDWMFIAPHHVAMYYKGKELGANQRTGDPRVCTINLNRSRVLGAMRYKFWEKKSQKKGVAEIYDPKLAGKYSPTVPLNLRTGGSTEFPSLTVLQKGTEFQCYGYAHKAENGDLWLYGQANGLTGFCSKKYLKKNKKGEKQ